MADTDHCGACFSPCETGQVCFEGGCAGQCPEGLTNCGGACVDLSKDAENCGTCGTICPYPAHASPVCQGSGCTFECEPGWSDINGLPDDGCEEACSFVSPDETCNGVDDNCNGVVDEGFDCPMGRPTTCLTSCLSEGTGTCRIDCTLPGPDACTPPAETCNGADDDCDGAIDNSFPCRPGQTVSCTTLCGTEGSGPCSASCEPPTGTECASADAELCNGADDNCNGAADETFACVLGTTTACTTSCGSTGSGPCSNTCDPPGPSACTPPPETCNGLDDDCDGSIDETFDCPMGSTATQACGNCGTRSCTSSCTWGTCNGEGACTPGDTQSCGACGDQTCLGDCTWGTCSGGGECAPGTTAACGLCGTRTCGSDCRWSACTGEGVCSPGTTQSCGMCGTQTCLSTCRWDVCVGGGVCTPGSTASCTVGSCTGTQTCDSTCAWGACDVGTTPTNDTCAGAINVGSGGSFPGTTCGATNDYTATCAGGANSPDVVYRLDITQLSTVTVDLCGGSTWDTALFIRSGSCTGTQVGCNDDACGLQSRISMALDPGTYYIFVDGYSSYGAGTFTLNVNVAPYTAPNDTCATPSTLYFGGTTSGSMLGSAHNTTGSCGGAGNDVVYSFTTYSTTDVFIAATSTAFDPILYASSTCGGSTWCNDNAAAGLTGSILTLGGLASGTYYLVVDSPGTTSGTFTIEAYSHADAAAGDNCGSALILSNGATGSTISLLDDFDASCRNNNSSEAVYAFIVETARTVTVNTCTGTSYDSILYFRDDCDTGTDIACDNDSCGSQSSVSAYFSPGVYFLYVDGNRGLTGTYTLTVSGL
jgi:hypothetical protein